MATRWGVTTGASLLLLLLATTSDAATYSVARTGSDRNPGTAAQPWRSLSKAMSRLRPGDTLLLQGGTYNENLASPTFGAPRGTAAKPITIRAAGSEPPIVRSLGLGSGQAYLTIKDIIFDANNAPESNCIHIGGGAHHITVEGGECRNAGVDGLTIFYGGPQIKPHDITIRGMKIHHNGYHTRIAPYVGHGLYINGDHILVEGNEIYANAGAGLQFGGYQEAGHRNIVQDNLVHDNGARRDITSCGIQTSIGTEVKITNNVVANEPTCGIQVAWTRAAIKTEVANNTLYNVGGTAFLVFKGPDQTYVHHNLVAQFVGTTMVYQDGDTNTRIEQNLFDTVDPKFVDPTKGDFRLQAGSPAAGFGATPGRRRGTPSPPALPVVP